MGDLTYFKEKTKRFAEYQGNYSDAEFPEKFNAFLKELPETKAIRKELLLYLIESIQNKYYSHINRMNGKCRPRCIYTIAFHRGIPFAEAELKKIHPINLFFDSSAEFIKTLPKTILKKLPSWVIGQW